MNTETTESTSATAGDQHTVTIRRRIWQELVMIAGRQIDPENAEVYWEFGPVADPYGVYRNLSSEHSCVGRLYFARNPGSSVWIAFGDLPDATRKALESKKHDEDLSFLDRFDGESNPCW
jgi:hypothetical protein